MTGTLNGGSDNGLPAYRDSSGRALTDYPRPSVAVDTALLTVVPSGSSGLVLSVLQVRNTDGRGWCLPGTFLHPGERLIDAVRRSLEEKAGVTGLQPRQLWVFDDPLRDHRGWVLSVAHVDAVPEERLESRYARQTRLAPVSAPGRLPYGHPSMVRLAVDDLRSRYAARPDPARLLPETFTLRALRLVHEEVAGRPLQRDTFRRTMQKQLTTTGETELGNRGRPAEVFTHR